MTVQDGISGKLVFGALAAAAISGACGATDSVVNGAANGGAAMTVRGGNGGSSAGNSGSGGNPNAAGSSAGSGGINAAGGSINLNGAGGDMTSALTAGNGGASVANGGHSAGGAGAGGADGAAASGPRLQLGILPDYDNAKSNSNGIAGFVARTSVVPFLASNYMNISSGSFNTAQAKSFIDEARAAGVKCASISLATGDSDVPANAQAQIAAAVAYGVQQAIAVQVRFGYEMNGNWSPSYHGGDSSVFKNTWAEVASAVHGAGGQMVWAPNIDGGGLNAYRAVLPYDQSTIDVVGLDFYHFNSSETNLTLGSNEVDQAFASIYPIVESLAKPFVLTETAVSYFVTSGAWPDATPAEIAEKRSWLQQLTSPALLAKYPRYRGFVWFDYNKHESDQFRDFSISQQPSEAAMFTAWVDQSRSSLTLGD